MDHNKSFVDCTEPTVRNWLYFWILETINRLIYTYFTAEFQLIEYWLLDFEDHQFSMVLLVICLLDLFEMTKKKTWKFNFYSFCFYIKLLKNDQNWIREKSKKEYMAIQLIVPFYSYQTGMIFHNKTTYE